MFGLREQDMALITQTITRFETIECALIFGSRALGNYKKGSDVDIAVKGGEVTRNTAAGLSERLNHESPLPYFFDVVHYESMTNERLRHHIDHNGIEIYKKDTLLHENSPTYHSASDD
ncbi:hypothetical protein GCM10008983_09400 [Lentibacillus halophilus]|uniref:Polymerase beta nucleotidyltransferase domain-containing protein n=1 Tax=Lentibacillus halophilus TaxID=295065 RepID=A0ABN0Z6M9_9BACI